ncbi:hypothetical protein O181_000559 [Austropuccinia psidii MF-1]|uniref:Uncharacterized protein n=1 Tax=Austropuccinia psidii MF-1 TaxID=1389203 RepID=A0A9Q3B8T6_9BASI|nr:hypothetical protein [Austropuccinia psidii MF-1]
MATKSAESQDFIAEPALLSSSSDPALSDKPGPTKSKEPDQVYFGPRCDEDPDIWKEEASAPEDLDSVVQYLTQVIAENQDDLNFPGALLQRAAEALKPGALPQDVLQIASAIREEMKVAEANSPYPEVRAIVDAFDDPTTPVTTFRLSITFAQLMAYPIGYRRLSIHFESRLDTEYVRIFPFLKVAFALICLLQLNHPSDFILPDVFFQTLSFFNWTTWIAPHNVKLALITGTVSGLGLNPFPTLDYNFFSINPIVTPLWSIINHYVGALFGLGMICAVFFKNIAFTQYLPINSNG